MLHGWQLRLDYIKALKGRSRSSGLVREEGSLAARSSQVPTTEGRPGAANLNGI